MSGTAEKMDYETLNNLLEDRGLIDDEGTRVEIKSGKGGLPNGFWTDDFRGDGVSLFEVPGLSGTHVGLVVVE